MARHAYLIMAHKQFYILEKLLLLIDDARNDIFIHVDKKVDNFEFEHYKNIVKHSDVIFIDRMDVRWADMTQVECTIKLLEKAQNYCMEKNKTKYKYYHFISGSDLPLKTQNYIHEFLDNKDIEFVHFAPEKDRKNMMFRYKYRCFFTKHLRDGGIYRIYNLINKIGLLIQKVLKLDKTKNEKIKIMFGANWFTITDDFAKYILSKKSWILDRFKYSISGDEEVVQTLIYNNPKYYKKIFMKKEIQKNNDHIACMRKIDWNRGKPYVWTIDDFQELMQSKCLFARKFDIEKDKVIVDKIYNTLING